MTTTYEHTRQRLETYFDRTASATWARLTSDAPVSRIRATVRAGRDEMRAAMLARLPADMHGLSLLDAGCGTGALAIEAARRGADVVAVDLAASLLDVAGDRMPADVAARIAFRAGDMLDEAHGSFDHVVAMDSLIHYRTPDIAGALARLAPRVRRSIVFTVAPLTVPIAIMYGAGKLFPRRDRSPAIVPTADGALRRAVARVLPDWQLAPVARVARGFYISQAWELRR